MRHNDLLPSPRLETPHVAVLEARARRMRGHRSDRRHGSSRGRTSCDPSPCNSRLARQRLRVRRWRSLLGLCLCGERRSFGLRPGAVFLLGRGVFLRAARGSLQCPGNAFRGCPSAGGVVFRIYARREPRGALRIIRDPRARGLTRCSRRSRNVREIRRDWPWLTRSHRARIRPTPLRERAVCAIRTDRQRCYWFWGLRACLRIHAIQHYF